MKNLWLITKQDFINLVKNPMWVFYSTAFPILLITILGFLTKDNFSGNFASYDFYGITLIIYSILMSGMTSANAFMELRIRKPNMRIIYAPGSSSVIYLSKILSSFLFNAISHLFDFILLCLIFHIHLDAIPQLFVLLLCLELFTNTLGVMCCCIFKTEAMANQILSIVVNLFAIFGGLMFPMDGYGKVIRSISFLSPAKWIAKASFDMIYDYDYSSFLPVLACLIIAILGALLICKLTFRKEDCIC